MMANVLLYGYYGGHWNIANEKTAAIIWMIAVVAYIIYWLIDTWVRHNGLDKFQ